MPVGFLPNEQRESYGRYTVAISSDDLARYFHLDDADQALIAKKRGYYNRFGFAVQLCTVRYLSTFLDDPLDVPVPVMQTLANQLGIEIEEGLRVYSIGEQRWQHAAEIRTRYGYVEITEHKIGFRLTRWLYSLCWTGTDRPSVLFERATTWLVTHKVLLPGYSTLERYIASLRNRVEKRLWQSLRRGISSEQQERLEKLLVIADGTYSNDSSGGLGEVREYRESECNSTLATSAPTRDAGCICTLPGGHGARRCAGSIGSVITRPV